MPTKTRSSARSVDSDQLELWGTGDRSSSSPSHSDVSKSSTPPDHDAYVNDLVAQVARDTDSLAQPYLLEKDRIFYEHRIAMFKSEVLKVRTLQKVNTPSSS